MHHTTSLRVLSTTTLSALCITLMCAATCDGDTSSEETLVITLEDMDAPQAPDAGMTDQQDMPVDVPDVGMNTEVDQAAPALPLTYYGDIKAIVYENCEACHQPGNVGPYPLDSYDSLKLHINMALTSIDSGNMPPWSPDPDCRNYKGQRIMSAQDIELLRAWADEGMLEGDPNEWVEPEPDDTINRSPDLIGRQNLPYLPTAPPASDDYQCYVIDLDFDEDTYVTGTTVLPGNRQLVHHANLFLVNPTNAPRLDVIQDRSPDPGYECFGDPGISQTNLVGAWVPGAQPIFMPEDAAIIINKGSKLVLQVHYNTLYADPVEVESEVHLFTRPTPPTKQVSAMPLANLTFDVAPGEKQSEHTFRVRNSSDEDWQIIGTGPHLHLLASAVKVEVQRKDDEPDECLVDIPDWDFNWQQEYRFRDDEWVNVRPGDIVSLTCTFDNSPENQPIIDGVRQQPQALGWGSKSSDEMCLNFLVRLQDYDPNKINGPLCSEFKECRPDCEDPNSVGCIFNCAAVEQGCGECLLFGAQDCAGRYCRDELLPTIPCLLTCAQGAQGGGDIDACMNMECPVEYEALETCMVPYIEQGLCNTYVEDCNVAF